jgi:hypothetical protein
LSSIPSATQTNEGITRLATVAESIDVNVNSKAVTPQGLKSNYVLKNGDLFTGSVGVPGLMSTSTPSLYFTYDDGTRGTGITSPIKNMLSLSTSGNEAVRILDDGKNCFKTTSGIELLNLDGNISFQNTDAKIRFVSDSSYGNVEIGTFPDNTEKLYLSKGINTDSAIFFGKKDGSGTFTPEMILNSVGELCLGTVDTGNKLNINGEIGFTTAGKVLTS